jgi:hypothetical protein
MHPVVPKKIPSGQSIIDNQKAYQEQRNPNSLTELMI